MPFVSSSGDPGSVSDAAPIARSGARPDYRPCPDPLRPPDGVRSPVLIPLGTDRPKKRRSLIVPVLFGVNLGVFLVQITLHAAAPDSAEALVRFGAVYGRDLHWWTPVTSAFLHADFWHIFGNMLALVVFGPPVEDRFGRVGFSAFYLVGAVGSGLAHAAFSASPAIGASGAIAAVSGAFLVLFPNTKIRCLWFLGIISLMQVPAWWLIGLYIVLDLLAQTFTPDNGIANLAHLGGYLFGSAVALVLLWTHVLSREPYDLFSILRQKNRKRQFQAVTRSSTPRPVKSVSKPDPISEELALTRSRVAQRVSEGNLDDAADRYLVMVDRFHEPKYNTTLHREAQYQIANHLFTRGDLRQALDAYEALLTQYPEDPERDVIRVLIARIRESAMDDRDGAIEILKDIIERSGNDDIIPLAQRELDTIRAKG